MTPIEIPPFESRIRPELIDALCQVTGAAFPLSGMEGRRMMSLSLDTQLALYFHQEAKRQMGLVRSRQRFGGRVTASSLLCEAMNARLPIPDDYLRLAEASARRREIFGDRDISVRVPTGIRERLEALAETLPSRKGIGFMSPKALAEVLALVWAGGNSENPFSPKPHHEAEVAPGRHSAKTPSARPAAATSGKIAKPATAKPKPATAKPGATIKKRASVSKPVAASSHKAPVKKQ